MTENIHNEAPRPVTGLAAIAVAIGFNVPFAILGATFEYPDVLRRPQARFWISSRKAARR